MSRYWVVDTWVLAKCNDFSCDDCLDCVGFLSNVLINGKLCLDHENEIQDEYLGYIHPMTWLARWWQKMIGEVGHLAWESNKLSNSHSRHLKDKLFFDQNDIKFIGVASRTSDKIIVTGDSDFNENVCKYLSESLGINVLRPDEALSYS